LAPQLSHAIHRGVSDLAVAGRRY
jgi:hypothetical protein